MANYLELLGTPEGQRLSALGYTPEQIFQGAGTPNAGAPILGGGAGYLPYQIDLANSGTQRGQLAGQMIQDRYQRMANPFNIVSALQEYADSGNSDLLNNPTLRNIAPSGASPYQSYLNELFAPGGASGGYAGAAGGSTQGGLDAATQQRIRDAYASNPQLAQQFFGGGHSGGIGAPASVMPGSTSGAPSVAVPAPGQQTAQQASARLLGAGVTPGMSQTGFRSSLMGGNVPGLGSLTEHDLMQLSPDQQGAYAGLLGSTGRVSNPQAAIAAHYARAAAPGLRLGSVGY